MKRQDSINRLIKAYKDMEANRSLGTNSYVGSLASNVGIALRSENPFIVALKKQNDGEGVTTEYLSTVFNSDEGKTLKPENRSHLILSIAEQMIVIEKDKTNAVTNLQGIVQAYIDAKTTAGAFRSSNPKFENDICEALYTIVNAHISRVDRGNEALDIATNTLLLTLFGLSSTLKESYRGKATEELGKQQKFLQNSIERREAEARQAASQLPDNGTRADTLRQLLEGVTDLASSVVATVTSPEAEAADASEGPDDANSFLDEVDENATYLARLKNRFANMASSTTEVSTRHSTTTDGNESDSESEEREQLKKQIEEAEAKAQAHQNKLREDSGLKSKLAELSKRLEQKEQLANAERRTFLRQQLELNRLKLEQKANLQKLHDVEQARHSAEAKAEAAEAKASSTAEQLKKLAGKASAAEANMKQARADLTRARADVKKLQELERKMAPLQEAAKQAKALEAQLNAAKQSASEVETLREKLKTESSNTESIRLQLAAAEEKAGKVASLQRELTSATASLSTFKQQESELKRLRTEAEKVAGLQADLRHAEAEAAHAKAEQASIAEAEAAKAQRASELETLLKNKESELSGAAAEKKAFATHREKLIAHFEKNEATIKAQHDAYIETLRAHYEAQHAATEAKLAKYVRSTPDEFKFFDEPKLKKLREIYASHREELKVRRDRLMEKLQSSGTEERLSATAIIGDGHRRATFDVSLDNAMNTAGRLFAIYSKYENVYRCLFEPAMQKYFVQHPTEFDPLELERDENNLVTIVEFYNRTRSLNGKEMSDESSLRLTEKLEFDKLIAELAEELSKRVINLRASEKEGRFTLSQSDRAILDKKIEELMSQKKPPKYKDARAKAMESLPKKYNGIAGVFGCDSYLALVKKIGELTSRNAAYFEAKFQESKASQATMNAESGNGQQSQAAVVTPLRNAAASCKPSDTIRWSTLSTDSEEEPWPEGEEDGGAAPT